MFGRKGYPTEIGLILYYLCKKYREKHPNLVTKVKNPISWGKLLKIAEENQLLYSLSKRLHEEGIHLSDCALEKIIDKGERNISKMRKTLGFIHSLLPSEGIDFLTIKLHKGLPYVTADVDILVKSEDFRHLLNLLKREGMTIDMVKTFSKPKATCKNKGLLTIDIYPDISYFSLPFLDEEFLWEKPRTIDVYGIRCPTLSYEAELGLLFIHDLLGRRWMDLLSFLYINSLLQKDIDFDRLSHQTEKYEWNHAFFTLLRTIRNIHQIIYENENIPEHIDFPYVFPLKLIFGIFQTFKGMTRQARFALYLHGWIDSGFHSYRGFRRRYPSITVPEKVKFVLGLSAKVIG